MKTKYILLISLLFLNLSCNNWLDITSRGETSREDMFSDTKGYNTALAGVYYILTEKSLYGQSLSFGEIDLLARYWDISTATTHPYYQLSAYNYADKNSELLFNKIWSRYYEAVTNNNLILEEIKKRNSGIETPELIEGEALGLRAMIHLDLYRLFGPVVTTKEDLQKKSVPYRDAYDNISKKRETCEALLNYVKADLLGALKLLQDDPIRTTGRTADGNSSDINYNNILDRRVTRMNYYAVVGLLSRVELLLLNPDEAYKYAKNLLDEVEENKLVKFVDIKALEAPSGPVQDFAFASEHFFALHVNNLYETTRSVFGNEGGSIGNVHYWLNKARYNNIVKEIYTRLPEGQATDIRLRFWFQPNEKSTQYDIVKLRPAKISFGISKSYLAEVPVLKLVDMYFIACESQIGKDNNLALKYLNQVRVGRGLIELSSLGGEYTNEEMFDFLIREARKEYLACGQMFFLYKRLFAPIYVKAGLIISPTNEIFELPIPVDELEFS